MFNNYSGSSVVIGTITELHFLSRQSNFCLQEQDHFSVVLVFTLMG